MRSDRSPRSDRSSRASWRQTTIHAVVGARPIHHDAGGNGQVLAYHLTLANRATIELDADVVCERLANEHRERLLLTVDRGAHILARHMRGQWGGVFLQGVTITGLLDLFRRHYHDRLVQGKHPYKIKVSCDRAVGTSGIASASELARRGLLSDDDRERLSQLKEEVFATNLRGNRADRAALVTRVNREWRDGKVRLLERNGVVLPSFIATPQPTRSFVIVLDRPPGISQPDDRAQIRTMYPGELLCGAPAPASGTQLAAQADLRAYRQAFEVWYEHGLLIPAQPRPRHQTF